MIGVRLALALAFSGKDIVSGEHKDESDASECKELHIVLCVARGEAYHVSAGGVRLGIWVCETGLGA